MKRAGLAVALAAAVALVGVPVGAAGQQAGDAAKKKRVKRGVKPKTGRWSAKLDNQRFVELDVTAASRKNRRISLYRLVEAPCVPNQVGEFLGASSRKLGVTVYYQKGRKAKIKPGSFGTFFTVAGDRTVEVVKGSFSTSRKGKVQIRTSGADPANCPHVTTWEISYGKL